MPFDPDVAARVLARSGRRCCLCRRFDPTRLQVHHIVEESQGGASDEENAIPLCVTCHVDVHSNVPFTRRFSGDELVQHRDAVYALVAAGKLVEERRIVLGRPRIHDDELVLGGVQISRGAADILMPAAEKETQVLLISSRAGIEMVIGDSERQLGWGGRDLAAAKSAIEELERAGLLKAADESRRDFAVWDVTLKGYQFADVAMTVAS